MNPAYPRGSISGRTHSRNRKWTANSGSTSTSHSADVERWERGGGLGRGSGLGRGGGRARGGGRGAGRGSGLERGGRKFQNQTLWNHHYANSKRVVQQEQGGAREADMLDGTQEDANFWFPEIDEPELETQEEREKFYHELVKAREAERKKAIAEGKMDDPLVPKRLEDAITMVGTCMDMCPRFERYRRERENNLFEWETIPGTKRVDHKRAVKMYERAAGDKTLPSDLRPPKVLKRTLDYLFHDLLPRGGFSQTYTFIRDRSRAVRNDFTMQHESGRIAIECHDRCARFHILALHFERDKPGFSIALEEQQLMNTLQSLKEFYTDQRPQYTSPTELEMRVYHRLIHIRDQRERHEDVPPHITSHPVFKLTTLFRLHVQDKSAPITKTSSLVVDYEGMRLFGELANVLKEEGNMIMIYLVACILETLFGKDTIEDIESIRGKLRVQDIIDGSMEGYDGVEGKEGEDQDQDSEMEMDDMKGEEEIGEEEVVEESVPGTQQISFFNRIPPPATASSRAATSVFANLASAGPKSVFGGRTFGASASTAQSTSVFGTQAAPVPKQEPLSISGAASCKSLADAPPLDGSLQENNGALSYLKTPPRTQLHERVKSVFGETLSSGSSSSVMQVQQVSEQISQTGAVAGSVSFFGNKQTSLNPNVQAFVPGSASPFGAASQLLLQPQEQNRIHSNTNGIVPTSAPPVLASVPAPSLGVTTSTTTSTPPTQSQSQSPQSLTCPQKPLAPPSLRIDTQSLTLLPSNVAIVGQDGSSTVPISITPTVREPASAASATTAGVNPSPSITRNRLQAAGTELMLDARGANIASPTVPPALGRRMPVSLPSTPSTSQFAFPYPINRENSLATPTNGTPFQSQRMPGFDASGSGNGLGVLSPLDVSFSSGSGTAMGFGFPAFSASPSKVQGQGVRSSRSQSLLTSVLLKRDKGKGAEGVSATMSSSPSISAVQRPVSSPPPTMAIATDLGTETTVKCIPTNAELTALAQRHCVHKVLSKIWARWKSKYEEAINWVEAVQNSDAYRVKKLAVVTQKEKERKRRRSIGGGEKKMEEEGRAVVARPALSINRCGSPRKRQKKISDVFLEHRTDEEIAKRFRENRADHRLLWANGSYLSIIKTHIRSLAAASKLDLYPPSRCYEREGGTKPWNIWLSLNPESDSSAIWIERKFDVPKSGRWANEIVFEIPVLGQGEEDISGVTANGKGKAKAGIQMEGEEELGKYTGLIVFECVPTDLVKDDIEKKYCILDDCSRLRDIVDALSSKRHYIPSLLVLRWGNGEGQEKADEFTRMVKKYVDESVFAGYATLGITTTVNLDQVLSRALQSIKLDVEGLLVRSMTIRGIFSTFEEEFNDFLIEWLDNCSTNGHFDWVLYAHLIQATIGMLNKMCSLVSAMLSKPKRDLLLSFDVNGVNSSDTAYEISITWLSHINDQGDTERIALDLKSHINVGRDFPVRTFIQHLLELTVLRTEKRIHVASSQTKQDIPIIDIEAASELFENAVELYRTQLNLVLNVSVRRSPKRRGMSEESVSPNRPQTKRLKMTPSYDSSTVPLSGVASPLTPPPVYLNGEVHSPLPSVASNEPMSFTKPLARSYTLSTASSSGSPPKKVTVAMLRALTRDTKNKYGSKTIMDSLS